MEPEELERVVQAILAAAPEFGEERARRLVQATPDDFVFDCQGMEPGPFERPVS